MEIKRFGANGRRSAAVVYDKVAYLAGMTATDIEGDLNAQLADVFGQIERALAACGTDKHHVLSANVTLADIDHDYGDFNAAWDLWVDDGFEPVRSVTGGALALPQYKVKISVIAAL